MNQPRPHDTPLHAEVADRFGVLPDFFRLAPDSPEITANLWGFAGFGYLDNPLPPLFKERLFVYLSRFCEVRYCIARHVGFLVGLGRPSGDSSCRPETPDQVVKLIRRPLPRGDDLEPHLALLRACSSPPPRPPEPDTPDEEAVFACATNVFLQTPQAKECLEALRRAFDGATFEHLLVFLSFVRTAHFWTKVHPELRVEDDVTELLAIHEPLAECVLNDPEAATSETTQVLLDELSALRRERAMWDGRERLVGQLREQDQRKDDFLATLAHELRNPLAPIQNGLQIMKLAGDDRQAVDEARALMERQVTHMVRLIDDLMDVSRITRNRLELRRERADLAVVVRNAVETIRPLIEASDHELSITVPARPICVDADVTRLSQVFSNLLNNAAKYTEPGGDIALVVERLGGDVVVTVRDSGVGIPPEMLPNVFDMFTQVDRSPVRSQGGLGIGLSLVKTLVEMHGGSVEARSEEHRRGSEFVVRLPIVVAESVQMEAPEVEKRTNGPTSALRILVVDDNVDSARTLTRLLNLLGHETCMAHDGGQAVEVAEQHRPKLMLLDIGLPVMNGYEVARAIRERNWGREVTIVALTGWGQEDDRRRSKEAGIDEHLVKPIDPATLEKLLSEMLTASS